MRREKYSTPGCYREFTPEPLYLPLELPLDTDQEEEEENHRGARVIIIEMFPE